MIINVSNPSAPSLVTYIPDGADYTTLDGPFDIALCTVKINSSTFALVTAFFDHGVQIIDITDPSILLQHLPLPMVMMVIQNLILHTILPL